MITLASQNDSIKLTMEKETRNILAFPGVFINNKDHSNLIASVYCKRTFTVAKKTKFLASHLFITNLALSKCYLACKANNTLFDAIWKIRTIIKYPKESISRWFDKPSWWSCTLFCCTPKLSS